MAAAPFLPFRTARLLVRAATVGDAAALAGYRNDPETARYQSWAMPYGIADALELIAGQAGSDGPPVDDWLQLALDDGHGALIGDVGVHLLDDGRTAEIGYTLAPAARGVGLATEAVGGVVDRLFELTGVHRIEATIDPDNYASARVLERLGFRYEGRAVQAVQVRGQWCDEDRYALLAADRAAWLARPTGPVTAVRLVEVTEANLDAVYDLRTTQSQRRFVAPMERSLAQALVPGSYEGEPVVPWFRAIEADGELAGFVMLAEPTKRHPAFLWRLLVDRRFQGRGVGRLALAEVVAMLRARGLGTLEVTYVEGLGGPAGFYRKLGFVPTGAVEDGETVARLELG